MRKYLTEFIGTFFFVLVICASVLTAQPLAALAIGSALMVMIYAGGHISGGHYNPAVSLAAFIRGRLDTKDLLPYWASQLLGAALAAGVAVFVVGHKGHTGAIANDMIVKALLVEFLFTFALAYVVLNVATSKDNDGNSFYGLAIGFIVLCGAISLGAISGGAFNPAVALGVTLAGLSSWSSIWIFLVANLLGGAAAGYAFKALNPTDK